MFDIGILKQLLRGKSIGEQEILQTFQIEEPDISDGQFRAVQKNVFEFASVVVNRQIARPIEKIA